MKTILTFALLSLLSVSAAAANICEQNSVCVYSGMPIWNQGDSTLKAYINKKKNLTVKSDPGWCGMVSAAMFLRGVSQERLKTADMPDKWDATKIDANDYIVNAGELVKVNFKEGGTYHVNAAQGFDEVRSASQLVRQLFVVLRGRFYTSWDGNISATTIHSNIQTLKPLHYIGVGIYDTKIAMDPKLSCTWKWVGFLPIPKCVTVYIPRTYYERTNGHALVINGYDGKYFKIYDPWGRIYNVSLKEVEVEINGSKKTRLNFVHANGERGFAYSFGNKMLLVDSLTGWSLLAN